MNNSGLALLARELQQHRVVEELVHGHVLRGWVITIHITNIIIILIIDLTITIIIMNIILLMRINDTHDNNNNNE